MRSVLMPSQPHPHPEEFPLGYRFEHDTRNLAYALRDALPQVPEPPVQFWFPISPVLDQSAPNAWNVFNSCVGHGVVGALKSLPTWQRVLPAPQEVYLDALKNDPWPGEQDTGTSTLSGVKALQHCTCPVAPSPHNHVREYLWEYEQEDVVRSWVKLRGPVVLGTWWTTGMDTPNAQGIITPTGQSRGGHCYFLTGASDHRQAYRMQNSWGRSWGQAGRAWLPYDALRQLFDMGAEACVFSDVVPQP